MKPEFSSALLASLLFVVCAGSAAAADAVAPPAIPAGPAATGEKCPQEHAGCREHGQARFDEHFRRLDSDGDGTVSKAEAEKGAPRLARNFDAIDANKDGKLTPQEMQEAARVRMEQCRQDPEQCRAQMKQRFEADWKQADADGDGALSKAEAEKGMPFLAQHFEEIDANKDGRITPDEAQAARARHHHPHRAPKPDNAPAAAPKASS